ncbi:malonyl-CoA-ACP transacylase [Corynebacterium sp. KPL2830]|uniref:hypothetical protein n=1 Tax=unclassified Corynebacterium TaxID=2624378 RepID=UPI0003B918EF|nr:MULTISPECIES: hypothetical protein [unclassified Corynebacterium]ERS54495.1 hypothetical protein HMPREF1281_01201 [Corynebacterium sp. KPL1855]ERS63993.1 hypothetical protein HMPREF1257_00844 [Corynebacterium sp. KPL1814]ERS76678.1 hypothetical protein HMPREF1285_02015 [Corynebacterium sp. KPL1859]
MITTILAGLLAAGTGLTGPSTPTAEASPAAQHQEHASTATPDSDTSDVQALIDDAQDQAGYEFITVRYDGEFAHIALDPETYNPDSDRATFEAVSKLLTEKGYEVTAVL